jgi:hypothetical protein
MSADTLFRDNRDWETIHCLACGTARVAVGKGVGATGDCPCCGYLGWTSSDDLDSTTRQMITNGRLAKPPRREPAHNRSRAALQVRRVMPTAAHW